MAHPRRTLLFLTAALAVNLAHADDRWESSSTIPDGVDDKIATANELLHGFHQTHDLQGLVIDPPTAPTDLDFMVVETKAGHSYEVRVGSTNLRFRAPGCDFCVQVDRVDASQNV